MAEHWTFDHPLIPPGEPVKGKTYRADGWSYHDLPRLSYKMWDLFIDTIGEGNYVLLTFADYGNAKRGQILISPQGEKNLIEFGKSNDESL